MLDNISIKVERVKAIDAFRAITMVVMIFVNDLGAVFGVPHWLEHAAMTEDFLGFSDLVFPAFLVAMGMSIPLAIESKIQKGVSIHKILEDIVQRTFALVVMGLLLLNAGRGVSESLFISKYTFLLLSLLSFFLVWNVYPYSQNKVITHTYNIAKFLGYILLFGLIYIYRSPQNSLFQQGWWGILGLIGWAYAICAILYLYNRKKIKYLLFYLLLFILLLSLGTVGLLGPFDRLIPDNGCHQAFAIIGMLISLFLLNNSITISVYPRLFILGILGVGLLLLGWATNQIWIISKIQATPPWLFYSSGFSVLFYIFIYYLTDIKNKTNWFSIIKPAGTATLTCYLVPYCLYIIMQLTHFQLTDGLSFYPLGLLRCILIAFVSVGITAVLGKVGIKLKI